MITILFCLLSFAAIAKDCHQFLIRGSVTKNDDVFITINKDSNSQKIFMVDQRAELALAPFIDKFVVGKFIFKEKSPGQKAKILNVQSVDLDIPDPLTHKNSFKYLSKTTCPK